MGGNGPPCAAQGAGAAEVSRGWKVKEFKRASTAEYGAEFEDLFCAEVQQAQFRLAIRSRLAGGVGYFSRSDLTAIIAGLTAIRDAMPEGE